MRFDPSDDAGRRAHYNAQNAEEERSWREEQIARKVFLAGMASLVEYRTYDIVGPNGKQLVLFVGNDSVSGHISEIAIRLPTADKTPPSDPIREFPPSENLLHAWIVNPASSIPLHHPPYTSLNRALSQLSFSKDPKPLSNRTAVERDQRLSEIVTLLRQPTEYATALFLLDEMVTEQELLRVK